METLSMFKIKFKCWNIWIVNQFTKEDIYLAIYSHEICSTLLNECAIKTMILSNWLHRNKNNSDNTKCNSQGCSGNEAVTYPDWLCALVLTTSENNLVKPNKAENVCVVQPSRSIFRDGPRETLIYAHKIMYKHVHCSFASDWKNNDKWFKCLSTIECIVSCDILCVI